MQPDVAEGSMKLPTQAWRLVQHVGPGWDAVQDCSEGQAEA